MAEKMVKVRLPKNPATKEQYKIVGVNGRLMKIPLGQEVEIPESYLEVLQTCYAAEDASDIYVEKVQKSARKKNIED